MKRGRRWGPALLVGLLVVLGPVAAGWAGGTSMPATPLDMDALRKALAEARGTKRGEGKWPRTIHYTYRIYDFRTETFQTEPRTFEIRKRPRRIVAHAVGVTEILWAICPRERLVAFNDLSADPAFCFIADEVRKRGRIFKTKQTELLLGWRPDLVFTVFYSGAEFKAKLRQAGIPYFDLGYFGTLESIKEQTLLIGRVIGEEGNAEALVRLMDEKVEEIRSRIPSGPERPRILYYDAGGYVPGISSNFNSICKIIDAVDVGAEQGIRSWSQIDYETLLRWNPGIIIVPEGSGLKQRLEAHPVARNTDAVKAGRVYVIPGIYLRATSQFMILSADLLAGIVYAGAF